MADFTIKKGATDPPIQARLKEKDATTVTLTGAAVKFSMRDKITQVVKVNRAAATIVSATPPVDPKDPNVEYSWASGYTDTKGNYEGEWEVTFSNEKVQIYPDQGYNDIQVSDDVP